MDFQEAERLYNEGRTLWDETKYEAAARVLKQAAQMTESHKDDKLSPKKKKELQDVILEIWDWCALAMHSARQYENAVACNNRNLSVRLGSADYGPSNEDTLDNRRRLIENYSALGQHDSAIAECREILKVVDGSYDRNALAQQLFAKGDEKSMKEAVNINLYTLKRDETKLGRNHFSLCRPRYHLGVELYRLEKYEEARDFLQENKSILEGNAPAGESSDHALLLRNTKMALDSSIAKAHEVAERSEKERQKKERLEKKRSEEERLAKERLERERLEKERLERIRLDKERKEKERIESEKREAERQAREVLEKDRRERQRLEDEQRVIELYGQEKVEKSRQHVERTDPGKEKRLEKERIAKELLKQDQLEEESNRLAQEQKQKDREKSRLQEQQQRQSLIQKIKKVQSNRDRLVRSGNSLGLSPRTHSNSLTAELENSGSIAFLEQLCRSLEKEVKDWNRLLKADDNSEAGSSVTSEESRGRHKRASSTSSAPTPQPSQHESRRTKVLSPSPGKKQQSASLAPPSSIIGEKAPSGSGASSGGNTRKISNAKPSTPTKTQSEAPKKQATSPALPASQDSKVPKITYTDKSNQKHIKRSKSNETIRSNDTGLLHPEKGLERAASVDRKRRPISVKGNFFGANPSHPSFKADLWFSKLEQTAHNYLDKYKDYKFDEKHYNTVKIAVLDTGVTNSPTIRISKRRITWRKVDSNSLDPKEDEDGHGTQVASIILKVTPYAKLYVYRVTRRQNDGIEPKTVAAALEDAVKQGVDIVNMSFGWDYEIGPGHDELREALKKCSRNDILVFAATSNDDLESVSGMAYPARADGVIAIDAASSMGEWLPFNPTRDSDFKTHRFTALGEEIKADLPMQLGGNKEGWTRMNGTSAATPIAAGIAALVLEFARQPPLGYAPKVAEVLKQPSVMRELLAEAVSVSRGKNEEYRHLVPKKLFDSDGGDPGSWYLNTSPRHHAANSVLANLRKRFGYTIGDPMNERIRLEWQRALR